MAFDDDAKLSSPARGKPRHIACRALDQRQRDVGQRKKAQSGAAELRGTDLRSNKAVPK
jgi:hypothetical protein